MKYNSFLDSYLIPVLEREFNEKGNVFPHVVMIVEKKNIQKKSSLDNILKYEEDDESNALFTDLTIMPPHDLSTHDHIIQRQTRIAYPESVITTQQEKLPHKEQMNDYYKIFTGKIKELQNKKEVIVTIENYDKNERFLYELVDGKLILKEELEPLDRMYLPYLN